MIVGGISIRQFTSTRWQSRLNSFICNSYTDTDKLESNKVLTDTETEKTSNSYIKVGDIIKMKFNIDV